MKIYKKSHFKLVILTLCTSSLIACQSMPDDDSLNPITLPEIDITLDQNNLTKRPSVAPGQEIVETIRGQEIKVNLNKKSVLIIIQGKVPDSGDMNNLEPKSPLHKGKFLQRINPGNGKLKISDLADIGDYKYMIVENKPSRPINTDDIRPPLDPIIRVGPGHAIH